MSAGYEFNTSTLRFTYSSMTTPAETYDYDMAERTRVLRKRQEIPSGHNADDYVTRRLFAPAQDGETVPVSILYKKGTPLDGSIEKLVVYPENMKRNLDKLGGLHNSQRVLLALTQAGASREEAYSLVQRNAMKTWEKGADFLAELKGDKDVTARLKPADLEAMFDLGYHLKHVDTIDLQHRRHALAEPLPHGDARP